MSRDGKSTEADFSNRVPQEYGLNRLTDISSGMHHSISKDHFDQARRAVKMKEGFCN